MCPKNLSDSPRNRFSITDDGEPLCSGCELIKAKICNACGERILTGDSIIFSGMNYHTDCFRCSECHKPIADEKDLHTEKLKPCCKNCFKDRFAHRCAKCHDPIADGVTVTCEGKKYHQDCFRCGQCRRVVTEPEYYSHLGEPCCVKCYEERIAARCAHCFKTISVGKSITFSEKQYHSDCFRCSQCHKLLTDDTGLYKHNEKPCCIDCHNEYFAPKCFSCRRPITETKYTTHKNESYHINCFKCTKCHRPIPTTESFYNDGLGFICLTCVR